jgi:tetrahydromethanopterin S-methyltransferase subunit F
MIVIERKIKNAVHSLFTYHDGVKCTMQGDVSGCETIVDDVRARNELLVQFLNLEFIGQ